MTDKNILKITRQFAKGIIGNNKPDMMCFAITFPLQSYLSLCGLNTQLIEGKIHFEKVICNHYWLKLSDNRILDPTASQFNKPDGTKMPTIYLGEKPEWYQLI